MNPNSVSIFPDASSSDISVGSDRESRASSRNPSCDENGFESIENATDDILFERLCGGNKEALGTLFRRYAWIVRAVGLRILRDAAEADDLVQEVFLFLYRKADLFDAARGSARSWIVQVAYHRAIDRRRYLASHHFYDHLELQDSTGFSDGVSYEKSMEALIGHDELERIQGSLSRDQRRVLELYFYEGYTLQEIAREMVQTLGNVRNHYYRGLEKMRRGIFGRNLGAK
ncbi:RNA polymerase sigma factor [Edaphobacter acidisoli]|nr:sigma-70 family RNA polymerase sigma factor [Edaphobacter acidisoli]